MPLLWGRGLTVFLLIAGWAMSGSADSVGAAIAAGVTDTCALTTAGVAECWGSNAYGVLGTSGANRSTAAPVSGLSSGVAAIATGYDFICALTTAGGVLCWGTNGNGQLGEGTGMNRSTPTPVSGLSSGVAAIATGLYYACALTTAGGVECWGNNDYGQLGDGTTTYRSTATAVPEPGRIWMLLSGIAFSICLHRLRRQSSSAVESHPALSSLAAAALSAQMNSKVSTRSNCLILDTWTPWTEFLLRAA
jgi:alpha-tubulin suppressor-like RCC1 family protein